MVYGDRSSTSGYVVSDFLTYRELHENSTAVNASARVVFGYFSCLTTVQTDVVHLQLMCALKCSTQLALLA